MACKVARRSLCGIALANGFAFVRLVFEEVEVSAMLMFYPVCTGDSDHSSCEFAVLAVLVRELCSVKRNADLFVVLTVIAPIELRVSAVYHQTEVNRDIIYRNPGIYEFGLFAVFQLNDRDGTLSQRFAVVFPEIDIVHVVIIEDQSCAVLVHFRNKLHFGGDLRINAGQLSGKNAGFVQ